MGSLGRLQVLPSEGKFVLGIVLTSFSPIHCILLFCMEVSEVALNGAKRFAGITILEGYNANISIVAALFADLDGTRDASR